VKGIKKTISQKIPSQQTDQDQTITLMNNPVIDYSFIENEEIKNGVTKKHIVCLLF